MVDYNLAKQIFTKAIKLAPEDRGAFLDEQCGDDAEFRAQVESLLQNHSSTVKDPSPDRIAGEYQRGDTVAHFTIRDRLGSGGMGAVYLAEQSVPVKRRVALKVIKPGFDTRNTLARFQAERQALARMDHPCIAKVLEAGATDTGRPWFAMEYIKGEDLLAYCDENKLDTRQRLELFIKICGAIQHAHQRGIMHRDLKPGNILVTRGENDEPQPKVIDFGIAKAISSDLTDMTLHTVIGQLVGTLTYMSPEQVRGSDDIDTRTDVYTLGVILYELISGQVPFSGETASDSGQEAMKKSIREADPPKPSTQLSSVDNDEATTIAKARGTDTSSLQNTLRRELEWIPLKALRKDRGERYASPDDLAEDVQRYLDGEALEAGPVTRRYRVKKFVKRNKSSVITVASFVLVLIAATAVSLSLLAEADRQRTIADQQRDEAENARVESEQEKARAEAVKDFVTTMLSSVDPSTAGIMDKELMKMVLSEAAMGVETQFQDQPLVKAEIQNVIGITYKQLGQYDLAENPAFEAMKIRRQILGDDDVETLGSIALVASVLEWQLKNDDALIYRREALDGFRAKLGNEHRQTLWAIGDMAVMLLKHHKYDDALPLFEEAVNTSRRVLGTEESFTYTAIDSMGGFYHDRGMYEKALLYRQEALEGHRRVLGDLDTRTLGSISALGVLLQDMDLHKDAKVLIKEAYEGRFKVLGEKHPHTVESLRSLVKVSHELAKTSNDENVWHEAGEYLEKYLREKSFQLRLTFLSYPNWIKEEDPETLQFLSTMADTLARRYVLGPYLEKVLEYRLDVDASAGKDHPDTVDALAGMADWLRTTGSYDDPKVFEHWVKAMEMSQRLYGLNDPKTIEIISSNGRSYPLAIDLLTNLLEQNRQELGPDATQTIDLIGILGDMHFRTRYEKWQQSGWRNEQIEKALSYYTELLEAPPEYGLDTLLVHHRIADCWTELMRYDKAYEIHLEILNNRTRILGDSHPDTVESINNIISLLDEWRRVEWQLFVPESNRHYELLKYRQMLKEIRGANTNATAESPGP